MPYSNLTFQVQPNLELKPFDFILLSGTNLSTSTTTSTSTAVVTLWVNTISSSACAGAGTSLPTYSYTGTATLCGCTSLNAANATALSAGTYYVSNGINTRQFTSTGGGSTLLTALSACVAC